MKISAIILLLITIAIIFLIYNNFNKPVASIIGDEIKIIYPRDMQEVSGNINIYGMASKKFSQIEIKVDFDSWQQANNIENWNFNLDTTKLSDGLHIIYVRGYSNEYSNNKVVRIIVKNIK